MYTLAWKKYPDEKPVHSDDNEIIIARKREGGRFVLNTCNYDASTGEFYFDYWILGDHERDIIDDAEISYWICVEDLQHPVEKYKTEVIDFSAFRQDMLNTISKGYELSPQELLDLVMLYEVHREFIQVDGQYVDALSIILLDDKYFAIKNTYSCKTGDRWFHDQPYEVVETTKTVRDWKPIELFNA
jgi:hypothetical protein